MWGLSRGGSMNKKNSSAVAKDTLVKKLGSNWEIKNSGARFNGILGSKLV
jgi:hypothetical protein